MPEYIERDSLLNDIEAAKEHDGMGAVIAGTLMRYIKRQPAADVAPMRHGRWVYLESRGAYFCSECKNEPLCNGIEEDALSDYCPHCGAKMYLGPEGQKKAPD